MNAAIYSLLLVILFIMLCTTECYVDDRAYLLFDYLAGKLLSSISIIRINRLVYDEFKLSYNIVNDLDHITIYTST